MGGWLAIPHHALLMYQIKLSWYKHHAIIQRALPKQWIFFTTLTALLRNEFSSSACLPKELGGLPREFWRRSIGGVPGPRCSQSCWTSALRGDMRKIRLSETDKIKSTVLQFLVHNYSPFEDVNVTAGSRGRQCGFPPATPPFPLTRRSRSTFASLPQGDSEPYACCPGSPARSPWLQCWKWGRGPGRLRVRHHSGGFRQTPARGLGKEG